MPELPTDCTTLSAAFAAAAIAIASAAIATSALAVAYVAKLIHEWRSWRR